MLCRWEVAMLSWLTWLTSFHAPSMAPESEHTGRFTAQPPGLALLLVTRCAALERFVCSRAPLEAGGQEGLLPLFLSRGWHAVEAQSLCICLNRISGWQGPLMGLPTVGVVDLLCSQAPAGAVRSEASSGSSRRPVCALIGHILGALRSWPWAAPRRPGLFP